MCERIRTEHFLRDFEKYKNEGETLKKYNQESSNTEPMVKEKTAGEPVSNPK